MLIHNMYIWTGMQDCKEDGDNVMKRGTVQPDSGIDHVHQHINHVREDMDHVHQDIDHMHQDIDHMHQDIDHVHQDLDHVHQDIDHMHQDIDHVHQDIDHVHQDIDHVHQDIDHVHQDVFPASQHIAGEEQVTAQAALASVDFLQNDDQDTFCKEHVQYVISGKRVTGQQACTKEAACTTVSIVPQLGGGGGGMSVSLQPFT
jgi:septation ring formation regulator EzrA